ncbi:MAG: hypothetical protein AAF908_07215, partial [Pseudomonadota bacterium]
RPARRANPFLTEAEQREARDKQEGGRGMFHINRLIHRVAGGAQADDRFDRLDQAEAEGTTSRAEEDSDGDIPAFLRRQAN